jgi:hypothetical protein
MNDRARNRIAKAYLDKYLNDKDIDEHLQAIKEDIGKNESKLVYVCVAHGKNIELVQLDMKFGKRDILRINDLGYVLALSKKLLFVVYLVIPDEDGVVIEYMTINGKIKAVQFKKSAFLPVQSENTKLLTAFVEGFLSGYIKFRPKKVRVQEKIPIKKTDDGRIIIPGQTKPGRIIIPGQTEQKPGRIIMP